MKYRVSGATLLIVTAFFLSGCQQKAPVKPGYYVRLDRAAAQVDQKSAASMLSLYRRNNGLRALVSDPQLSQMALVQAKAMAAAGSVSASLSKDLKLKARMARIGEPQTHAVENVSAGYRTFAEAFSGWRESAKHNAVMLDSKGARFGLASVYAPGSKHKVFWSLIVAAPKP